MALPARGSLYVPQSVDEIRQDFLDDYRMGMITAGVANPAVQPNTDTYILGTALGNMMLGGYANIEIHARNQDEREAVGDALDAIREALGLPVVSASPSGGRIVVTVTGGGTVTFSDGLQFTLPNGLRGKVNGQHLGVANNGEVDVITIDTGAATELAAGQKVKFVAPPPNVAETAFVSANQPLAGGTDKETDERKRERIKIARQRRPSGGNWSHKVELALNSLASVQAAFDYPALGGPASERVVAIKKPNPALKDFSRTLSESARALVQSKVWQGSPSPANIVVSSAVDELVDIAIAVTLPAAAAAGGNGSGWLDATVWPVLVGGDAGRVSVLSVTATNRIIVSAGTATAPVAGQTHVSWWNPVDQQFETRLVTAVAGTAGAWDITLDKPLVASDSTSVATGDFISSSAVSSVKYGEFWRDEIMALLGPGENTADSARLPRALRHPYATEDWPSALTSRQLTALQTKFAEISDVGWSYRSLTAPTVPGSVATRPNILRLRRFALYQI